MSRLAAKSKWRDISEVTFEEGDRKLLANLIYCEAGGEPYVGQVAVGAVVINRVLSSRYPTTVAGGVTNVGQCVYFRTPIPGLTGLRIGGHIFY